MAFYEFVSPSGYTQSMNGKKKKKKNGENTTVNKNSHIQNTEIIQTNWLHDSKIKVNI